MRVFGIGDLHLSHSGEKPMDVFGPHWEGHRERIGEYWKESISPGDLVLVPGDISWAMRFEDAMADLEWLGALPGRKVIIRGNHDYWWPSLTRLRRELPPGVMALQNSAVDAGPCVVAGSRGWKAPGTEAFDGIEDGRILARELSRLRLSLDEAARLLPADSGKPLLVMTHFPPVVGGAAMGFAGLIARSSSKICAYGHIHAAPGCWPEGVDTELDGVSYRLVSADYLGFRPVLLAEV
jgi:predicted phosphohydrolase